MLYLASASPRRSDLLKLAGFYFQVDPAQIDEHMEQEDPACLVKNLALKKINTNFVFRMAETSKTRHTSPRQM